MIQLKYPLSAISGGAAVNDPLDTEAKISDRPIYRPVVFAPDNLERVRF
jgi:hypothetical protein